MTANGSRFGRKGLSDRFTLQFPQSLGEFERYEDAQKAVDHLSDQGFPVENLMIVGKDLRLVERVVARRTWGRVLLQGAISGIGTGVLLGLLLMLFIEGATPLPMLVLGLVLGVITGVLTAGLGYSFTQGRRDFDSMSKTIASRYEVLVEHKVAGQARELLSHMPGFRAGWFE